jgi:GH15 family glucan-1,4-alpha-glucosidase
MASRIEDYALIGDCESAALVARDGSLDWLCWPRFDSEACFAALLGTPDNGRWLIAPRGGTARVSRRYRPNTLILETSFETDEGTVTLVDFMPVRDFISVPYRNPTIVRLVVGERGRVAMHTEVILRFGFGAVVPWVTRTEDGRVRAVAGPDMVVMHTPVHLKGQNLTTVGKFTVSAGEIVPFVLTYAPSHEPSPRPVAPKEALQATESFWSDWASKCLPAGQWSDAVVRSLITLKALTYAPTGGIVAAPTTSLPEQFGGERNWDYRFCWLRDATLTLFTLLNAGFHDSAQAWNEWLLRAIAGSPDQLQIMYGIAGERRMIEWEADWLPGYEGAQPVRIGNAAHQQLQLDVYGEVMDAAHQARRSGLATHESGWEVHVKMLEHLAQIWKEPDEGIWEIRGEPRQFTHSKVMAWVAFDRAIKSAEMFGFEGPIDHWKKIRDEICATTCAHGFDQELGSFVQYFGSKEVDASLLLIPSVGFLPVDDPRIKGTIAAIERELLVDGLVVRYKTHTGVDGLAPGEGAFLACSFWLCDVYVLPGRRAEAEQLFHRLVALCNDVGLLSEEYDFATRRLAGNFPQAFSHVGLVNTAFNLTRTAKPVEQRSQQSPEAQTPLVREEA